MSGEEIKELINVEYTEMGNCLEINDNQMLVQRVNGATGGFSITLDTRVAHYTDDTVSCISNEENREFTYAYALRFHNA